MTRLQPWHLAIPTVLALVACGDQPEPCPTLPAANTPAAAAPDSFRVAFETGKGRFVVQVNKAWAPRGADRFHELVQMCYFDRVKFFRVLPGFIAQFGMSGDPALNTKWQDANIQDDPVKESNRKGTLTFATGGPNTRTTQMFINTADNPRLDGMGFSPIGRVVEGMDVVEQLYSGYGEGEPMGGGPSQDKIRTDGNAYLNRFFPRLDSVVTARVVTK